MAKSVEELIRKAWSRLYGERSDPSSELVLAVAIQISRRDGLKEGLATIVDWWIERMKQPLSNNPTTPAHVDELMEEEEKRKHVYGLLVAALKAKSPGSYLAFTLRVACGLTYREIADGLGLGSAHGAQRLVEEAAEFLASRAREGQ